MSAQADFSMAGLHESASMPRFRARYGFGIAVGMLALAVGLTFVLRPYPDFGVVTGFMYLFAIWAAAWWGGYVPGLLVCTVCFLMVPSLRAGRLTAPGAPTIPFVSTLTTCVLISRFSATRMRRERVLHIANEQLEGSVRARTTELQLANTKLQERLAEVEALYVGLVFGLGFLDRDLRFIRVNDKLAAINGQPPEAHIGRPLREMTSSAIADLMEPLCRKVVEAGEPLLDYEVQAPGPAGDHAFWSVACAPVKTEQQTIGIQVIVQNVTERKMAERALHQANEKLKQANGDLEQFAYSASHDLQEPLRMVAIYSQMLEKKFGGKLGPEGEEFIGYTVAGATRMGQLVTDLLAYTRASSWDWEGLATVDPNDSIDRAVSNLKLPIEQTNAVITRTALPQVEMHGVTLDQLFQNLISNAVKYHGDQRPLIAIGAERRPGEWLFSVADNGIGIEPQYKEQIFGVFKRLHTSAEFSGTGIGLAICQRILERRGGRLWVESEPGKGSTFFFTLPDTWEH